MGYKHGHAIGSIRSRELSCWHEMMRRCSDKSRFYYKDYGARGIKVCSRWLDFKNFLEDMGPMPEGMTLERLDNNKGYNKANCIWATRKQQARNRRSTRWITLNGKTKSLAEWCEEKNMNYARVFARISKLKWSVAEALGEDDASTK